MKVSKCAGSWAAVGSLLLVHEVPAGEVVGLRTPHENFFMAVRGVLPESTVVTGIQFYSNDQTVFPSVSLATDASTSRLPMPEATVRSVENVSGGPGSVTVSFSSPYRVARGEQLWAIVRMPSNAGLRARGAGGGPGIGWRESPGLEGERSLFSVDGSMNEFTPAFNISVVTLGQMVGGDPAKPAMISAGREFTVQARSDRDRSQTVFEFSLPKAGRVVVDIYSIAGRRLGRLEKALPEGAQTLVWQQLDPQGSRVPSGIYLYKVKLGEARIHGKLLLIR